MPAIINGNRSIEYGVYGTADRKAARRRLFLWAGRCGLGAGAFAAVHAVDEVGKRAAFGAEAGIHVAEYAAKRGVPASILCSGGGLFGGCLFFVSGFAHRVLLGRAGKRADEKAASIARRNRSTGRTRGGGGCISFQVKRLRCCCARRVCCALFFVRLALFFGQILEYE